MSEDTGRPPGGRPATYFRRAGRIVTTLVTMALVTASALLTVPAGALGTSTGWTVVSTPQTGSSESSLLMATACGGSWTCWAVGGAFPSLGNGQPHAIADRWNGSSWVAVGGVAPPDTEASLLFAATCAAATDCWAVGAEQAGSGGPQPLAEHWDGVAWAVVPVPTTGGGFLLAVTCATITDCWAVGASVEHVDSAQNPANAVIDHWDGTSWTAVPPGADGQPYDGLQGVACVSASDCWAVGYAGPQDVQWNLLPGVAPVAPQAQPLLEHWDGVAWSSQPVSGTGASALLDAVTCAGPSCWAGGATLDGSGNPATGLALSGSGTTWSPVPIPDPPSGGDLLTGLACTTPTACRATGATETQLGGNNGTAPRPYVEAWNGRAWSIEPSPDVMAFGYLTGVACVRAVGCTASGFAADGLGGGQVTLAALIEQSGLAPDATQGLWTASSDGGVFALGTAPFAGSAGGLPLSAPVTGMAAARDGRGYWLVARDGGVFSFGTAAYHGSAGGLPLAAPVVGMAPTPDGRGYWLVAADGGVFAYGDAGFHGSAGGLPLAAPVVGMAATPDGQGYWEVASDGGVFTYGDAPFDGSVPGQGIRAAAPVTGLVTTPDGAGYWITGADGAVYTYGDAAFLGSMVGRGLTGPVVAAADPAG